MEEELESLEKDDKSDEVTREFISTTLLTLAVLVSVTALGVC